MYTNEPRRVGPVGAQLDAEPCRFRSNGLVLCSISTEAPGQRSRVRRADLIHQTRPPLLLPRVCGALVQGDAGISVSRDFQKAHRFLERVAPAVCGPRPPISSTDGVSAWPPCPTARALRGYQQSVQIYGRSTASTSPVPVPAHYWRGSIYTDCPAKLYCQAPDAPMLATRDDGSAIGSASP